jgi:hypothetical protein
MVVSHPECFLNKVTQQPTSSTNRSISTNRFTVEKATNKPIDQVVVVVVVRFRLNPKQQKKAATRRSSDRIESNRFAPFLGGSLSVMQACPPGFCDCHVDAFRPPPVACSRQQQEAGAKLPRPHSNVLASFIGLVCCLFVYCLSCLLACCCFCCCFSMHPRTITSHPTHHQPNHKSKCCCRPPPAARSIPFDLDLHQMAAGGCSCLRVALFLGWPPPTAVARSSTAATHHARPIQPALDLTRDARVVCAAARRAARRFLMVVTRERPSSRVCEQQLANGWLRGGSFERGPHP